MFFFVFLTSADVVSSDNETLSTDSDDVSLSGSRGFFLQNSLLDM